MRRDPRQRLRTRVLRSIIFAVAVVLLPATTSMARTPGEVLREEAAGKPDLNELRYTSKRALKAFRAAAAEASTRRMRVVHMGDSHVQEGVLSRWLRTELQARMGDGGYGMMFPYSAASARPPIDYTSEHSGEWQCATSRRLPPAMLLGVVGVACSTADPEASFTLRFRRSVPDEWRDVRLFVKPAEEDYALVLTSAGREVTVVVPSDLAGPFVSVRLPAFDGGLTVRLASALPAGAELEFYGLSLESVEPNGVIVDMVGVGATRFHAQLHAELLHEQLQALEPDLVILDYGTNEYLYDDTIPPTLEIVIRDVIARIREAAPNASILLTSAGDLARKGVPIHSGPSFASLVKRIARSEGTAWYDWFAISGGQGSIFRWTERCLAQADNIHLNIWGYRLKGQLMAEALLKTLDSKDEPDQMQPWTRNHCPHPRKVGRSLTYKVKQGDSLWKVAKKQYGLNSRTEIRGRVEDIQRWNRLRSVHLRPGQKLTLRRSSR